MRYRTSALWSLVVMMAASLAASAAGALAVGSGDVELGAPVQVRGTRVRLAVPEDYVATADRPGFEAAHGAEIGVTEFLEPALKGMDWATMEVLRHRMSIHRRWPQRFGGMEGHMFAVSFPRDGNVRLGYVAVLGDDRSMAQVYGSVPKTAGSYAVAELRAALESAVLTSETGLDRSVYVQHRILPAEPLKLGGFFGGEMVHTASGSYWPDTIDDPVLFSKRVALKQPIPVEDRERVARVEFSKISVAPGAEAEECRSLTVNRLPALELTGSGRHFLTGERMRVYLLIVFEADGAGLVRGAVGGRDAEKSMAVLRKSAVTYAPKRRETETPGAPRGIATTSG